MRFLWILLFVLPLTAQEIPDRCSSSVNCKSCHAHIVKDWQRSWHAKSHTDSNEYYRKTLEYIALKQYKSTQLIQLECAACHSPRIGITSIENIEPLAYAFDLEDVNTEVGAAIEAETLKEGINCIVCHKIEAIHAPMDTTLRGNNMLTWLKPGVIGGPYKDSHATFHQSQQQRFFNNPDKLCLVCHDNLTNSYGVAIGNTGEEYREVANKKQCVECHMGEKQKGFAALVPDANGEKKPREIRRHLFAGAHSNKLLKDALDVSTKIENNKLYVTLYNPNPHAVPTGFGGREIVVDVKFSNGYSKTKTLTGRYKNKKGRGTIPHLAVTQDLSEHIQANDSKTVVFEPFEETTPEEVTVSFRLVTEEIAVMLELTQPQWTQKRLIKTLKISP